MSGRCLILRSSLFSRAYSFFWRRDEDTLSKNDFLGTTLIPLYALYDGMSWLAWFPLHKRSSKSNISGEIEIELCCERVPGLDPTVERLYREVTQMPDMYFNMLHNPRLQNSADNGGTSKVTDSLNSGTEDSSSGWQSLREAKGFPFHFPPAEAERLEDLSIRATLIAQTYFGKVSSPGILFLTNYRLIFVSRMRLSNDYHLKRNNLMKESDLTCNIALGSICDLVFSNTDTDHTNAGQLGEALSVKTIDGKSVTFFINASDSYDFGIPASVARDSNKEAIASVRYTQFHGVNSTQSPVAPSPNDMHTRLNGKKSSSNINNRVLAHSTRDIGEDYSSSSSRRSSKLDSVDSRAGSMRLPSGIYTALSTNSLNDGTGSLQAKSPIAIPSLSPVTVENNTPCEDQATLQLVGVSKAWEALCQHPSFSYLDALDSEEGGPATRMYGRLYLKASTVNFDDLL
jgi:hypothetical protein